MKLSRTVVSIAAVAALVAIPGAAFADSHVADDQSCEAEAPEYGGVCPDDDDKKPTPKPTPAPTQKVIRTLQTR
ncbi:hypothetical protein [Georgenia muralis]|uniref:Uncharacterized protein n=1 Tax=Georgenia muralis TaxID=154117 RepID=A0A3N4Z1A5_9MICO|nr:hypothetical protein [Georgenia muralis]RPF26377.1 hypothetical protein EDD32_0816 [Georgenia muralis]